MFFGVFICVGKTNTLSKDKMSFFLEVGALHSQAVFINITAVGRFWRVDEECG